MRHLPLALFFLAALAGPVGAQGVQLFWNDCAYGGGAMDRSAACNTNFTPPFRLVISVASPQAIEGVVGAEGSIVLTVDGPIVPEFWRLEPGGCRADALSADPGAGFPYGCPAPWSQSDDAQATVTFHPYTECSPNRAVFLWSVQVPEPVTVGGHVEDFLVAQVLRGTHLLDCAGCTTPACLATSDVRLRRAPDDPRGDVTLEAPVWSQVTWQGGGTLSCGNFAPPDCPVPSRSPTWGQIKSMYR